MLASGNPSPTYQWSRNGSPINGAFAANYTTPATTKTDDGITFSAVVTNSQGTLTSNSVNLKVQWAPTITSHPSNQTVTEGQTATFTVTSDANPASAYQWQKDGQPIAHATQASYTAPATSLSDNNAIFTVVVSNGVGSQTSNPATLTVKALPVPPSITTQPVSATVQTGHKASFNVVGAGTAPLSYQWRKNGTPISSGGTSDSYSIDSAQSADAGSYDVIVNNVTNQPVTSDTATLTVTPAPQAPSITSQPLDVSVTEGNSASFSVVAGGTAPLSYQWQKNQVDIGGATLSSYTVTAAALADTGAKFRCHVTNATGNVYSDEATLTVSPASQAPVITSFKATPSSITFGQSTTLSWAVTGANTLTIYGVGDVTGLTSKQVTPYSTCIYELAATNAVGTTNSTTTVQVDPAPTYALSVSLGAGITGTPSATASYPQGTAVNYSYALQAGYQNLQVTLDGNPVPASGSVTMTAAHSLVATATPPMPLTVNLGTGTTGVPLATASYAMGTVVAYSYYLQSGYSNLQVTLDGSPVLSSGSVTMNAAHTISVTAQSPAFTITATAGTGGSISPNGAVSVNYGGSQTFTITPMTGYQIADVLVDGNSQRAITSYSFANVTANHTISAIFIPTYSLTISLGTGILGSPSTSNTYQQGTSVPYGYSLQAGYQNLHVTLDGNPVPASGAVTMNAAHTIAATASLIPPTLTSFTPTSGPVGTVVAIYGQTLAGATSVKFNGAPASFSVVSDSKITATVPAGATTGMISILMPSGNLNSSGSFTVVTPPTIANLSPSSGPVGSSVTIQGTYLTGATSVRFAGVSATFTVNSDTQITATVPVGASNGVVEVSTPSGTTTSPTIFAITNPPTVISFTPTSGLTGTSVVIKGTYFSLATAVKFNGVSSNFSIDSSTQITAGVPLGATTGPISITSPYGTATSTTNFTLTNPPAVSNFSPSTGAVGASVVLQGTNFTGTTSVTVNGTTASFTVNSDTQITASIPTGATTGKISVTTPYGSSTSAGSFNVTMPPVITSFTPSSNTVGTWVSIYGTYLSPTTTVQFNGTSATFQVANDNAISAKVPAGATTGPITVATDYGSATSATNFTITNPFPPTITSLSTSLGRVGDSVNISGTNFTATTSVTFNGTAAIFTVLNDTTIVTGVPPGATTGPIVVTTTGGSAVSGTFQVQ